MQHLSIQRSYLPRPNQLEKSHVDEITDARGDQCDSCGNLLDPLQPAAQANDVVGQPQESKPTGWLINPRCKLDGATPEPRATKHLFLRLDALKDDVVSWFRSANKEWSANCVAITESWISRGLQARGITRDLKWGVPSTFCDNRLPMRKYCALLAE